MTTRESVGLLITSEINGFEIFKMLQRIWGEFIYLAIFALFNVWLIKSTVYKRGSNPHFFTWALKNGAYFWHGKTEISLFKLNKLGLYNRLLHCLLMSMTIKPILTHRMSLTWYYASNHRSIDSDQTTLILRCFLRMFVSELWFRETQIVEL